jgi:hypothetical protein
LNLILYHLQNSFCFRKYTAIFIYAYTFFFFSWNAIASRILIYFGAAFKEKDKKEIQKSILDFFVMMNQYFIKMNDKCYFYSKSMKEAVRCQIKINDLSYFVNIHNITMIFLITMYYINRKKCLCHSMNIFCTFFVMYT